MAGDFEDLNIKVSVDASGAEDGFNKITSSIDKASEDIAKFAEGINFADKITEQAAQAQSSIEGIATGIDVPSIDIPVTVSADTTDIKTATDSLSETQQTSENLRTELSTPFVITAGDVIQQAQEMSSALEKVATSYAKNVEAAGRASLVNVGGPSAADIQAIAQAGINADATINDNLAMLSKLEKKGVDTYDGLVKGMAEWQALGEANAMTGAEMYDATAQSMNAFQISMDGIIDRGDEITTIGQKWSIGLEGLNSGITRAGFSANQAGLTFEELAAILQTGKSEGKGPRFAMELNSALKELMSTGKTAADADFLPSLLKSLGLNEEKFNKYTTALKNSAGAQEEFNKVEETGHTAWQNISADIDKATYSLKGMVAPLEPAAAGVLGVVTAGAQLAIFDRFLAGGRISAGIADIAKGLPLIGSAAGGAAPEVGMLGGALTTLAGPAVLGAAAIGIAAYVTNFGGFRDNVNAVVGDIEKAMDSISKGNYESAGRDVAKSFADGLGTIGDLILDVIGKIPDADRLLRGFNDGMKAAAKDSAKGFTDALISGIKELSSQLVQAGTEGGKSYLDGMSNLDMSKIQQNVIDGLKSVDWMSAGENAMSSMMGGMSSIVPSLAAGIGESIISNIKQAFINLVPGATKDMVDSMYANIPVIGDIWAKAGYGVPQTTAVPSVVATPKTAAGLQYVPSGQVGKTTYTGISTAQPITTTAPSISSLDAGIAAYAKENDLKIAQVTEMANASDNFKNSLIKSGDSISSASTKQTDAISKSTESTTKQDDAIQKIISSSSDFDAFQDKMISAGYTQADALKAWEDKSNAMANTTDSLSRVQTKSSDRISTAADKTASALDKISTSTDKTTDNLQSLRDKYAEVSKIDPTIIAQMNREDLIRNLALYGVEVGSINEQLGGTVDQLQQVATSVSNIGATDAFSKIQNKFQDLKAQFESGSITQDQYLDGLRKASAETDTLSRSTNALKGEQKETILSFEREIKEALRRIEAGTYGKEPLSSIGSSISKLGGISSGAGISESTIGKLNQLDDAYKSQGITAGKAAALQFVLNDALSDGSVKLSEAYSYLGAYNRVIGDNSQVTQDNARDTLDMMNALQQANQLQQMYTDAMKNGSISTDELSGIQSQQQAVQDALTQASQNALTPTGQLPGALQAVANTVSSVMNQIYNALSQAQSAAAQATEIANTQASRFTPSGGELSGPQVSSNTVNISNNQFGQTTTPESIARAAIMSFGAAI